MPPQVVKSFAWWDRPEPFNARAGDALTLPTALTTARTCQLADLDVVALVGAAGGSVGMTLRFRNRSTSACALRGVPRVRLLDAAGTVWQSTARSPQSARGPVVVLVPGSWGESNPWMLGPTCGGVGVTTVVAVSLPGQEGTRAIKQRLGGPWSRDCGPSQGPPSPSPGHLGGPAFAPIDPPSPGGSFLGLSLLDAALRVPSTVPRGSVLRYQLVLTADQVGGGAMDGGTDDGTVCPLYDVRLTGVDATYELRCDTPVILAQGQSAAYELQVKVPADAAPGPTTLSFQFLEPALPALTARLTITR